MENKQMLETLAKLENFDIQVKEFSKLAFELQTVIFEMQRTIYQLMVKEDANNEI